MVSEIEKLAPLLARWHAKLKNWHAFGENLARFWHVGTLARGHVDHTGTPSTHGTRFSKLNIGMSEINYEIKIRLTMTHES